MNKTELIEKIAANAEVSKAAAKKLWMLLQRLLRKHLLLVIRYSSLALVLSLQLSVLLTRVLTQEQRRRLRLLLRRLLSSRLVLSWQTQ